MTNTWKRPLALGLAAGCRLAVHLQKEPGRKEYFGEAADAFSFFGGKTIRPQFKSLADFTVRGEGLLQRQSGPVPLGQPSGTVLRDVIVVDNFYEDPDAVRRYALDLQYAEYLPRWHSSALEIGDNPLKGKGVRLATPAIKSKLSQIVGSEADDATWGSSGDGWNGAFHYKTGSRVLRSIIPIDSSIHNHVGRDEDVRPGGWSGLIYLNEAAPAVGGTSIWMHRATGRCWALEGTYSAKWDDFELVLEVENRYNRLILFYASVFHLASAGWGSSVEDARLFQTFFWNVRSGDRPRSWQDREGGF